MNPLEQLKPMIAPDPVSVWPLAPGWWLLFCILAALALLAVWLWRHYQRQLPLKKAMADLKDVDQLDPHQLAKLLNRFLKEYYLQLCGMDKNLTSYSEWQKQLQQLNPWFQTSQGIEFLSLPYRQDFPQASIHTDTWIKQTRETLKSMFNHQSSSRAVE